MQQVKNVKKWLKIAMYRIAMYTVQLDTVNSRNQSLPLYLGPHSTFLSINFYQCRHPNFCLYNGFGYNRKDFGLSFPVTIKDESAQVQGTFYMYIFVLLITTRKREKRLQFLR